MIPTAAECYKLMEKYHMLNNIKTHSIIVEKVARVVVRGLLDAGVDISLDKTAAGALMHDIGKTLCLNTAEDHSVKGSEICLQNDMDEIADIVGEHVVLQDFDASGAILEKEVVYYADKRVKHDMIVSLEERLEYLIGRYGRKRGPLIARLRENFELCKRVEKKIFACLNFRPEDLGAMVK